MFFQHTLFCLARKRTSISRAATRDTHYYQPSCRLLSLSSRCPSKHASNTATLHSRPHTQIFRTLRHPGEAVAHVATIRRSHEEWRSLSLSLSLSLAVPSFECLTPRIDCVPDNSSLSPVRWRRSATHSRSLLASTHTRSLGRSSCYLSLFLTLTLSIILTLYGGENSRHSCIPAYLYFRAFLDSRACNKA